MTFSSLKDAIDSLGKSLHISTSFPSLLFVFVNAFFILPNYSLSLANNNSSESIILLTCLSLIISFTLYAFNSPLIQLFEGYILRDESFFQERQDKHRRAFSTMKEKITKVQKQMDKETGGNNDHLLSIRANLEMTLNENYPPRIDQILPTKVGNVIAAFENYPKLRYGIDTIALWTRLVPILKENRYLEFVSHEKTIFDFHMNMCLFFIILGLENIYLSLYFGYFLTTIFTFLLSSLTIWILYNGMINSAKYWGETMCVAYDLYRHDLSKRLGLKEAQNFKQEYERWQRISAFILYSRSNLNFDDFLTQSEFLNINTRKEG